MEIRNKEKIKNIVFIILIALLVLSLWNMWNKLSHLKSAVTVEQAIEIGKLELKQRGYSIENMRVEADENNSSWQKSITRDSSKLQKPIVKRLNLEEKKYWAIYYAPKDSQLGGDAWVFIDINTGEVIGVILGE